MPDVPKIREANAGMLVCELCHAKWAESNGIVLREQLEKDVV